MAITIRAKRYILFFVTQVLPVLGTLTVLAFGVSYWLENAMYYSDPNGWAYTLASYGLLIWLGLTVPWLWIWLLLTIVGGSSYCCAAFRHGEQLLKISCRGVY